MCEVWEVIPTSTERRAAKQRIPVAVDRRRRQESRIAVQSDLRAGWLAFQCKNERRRLAPIPNGWGEMSDAELAALLDRAVVKATPRRLLD
jgi:hypothetical protein